MGKAFFLCFQMLISQIFLNLFIAIVIDAYSGQAQVASLPVSQRDIDTFVEAWSKFDPEASGYISTIDLEDLLIDLCATDCSMMDEVRPFIDNEVCRDNFVMGLDIPTHNSFSSFMFYDVI